MVRGIEGHTVISLAAPHGIAPHNRIVFRVNHSENVLVLEVHIHFAGNRIVLRHPRFTVEVQCLHDRVRLHVHDSFGLASFIGDVQFVERRGVGAPVGFFFRGNLFDYLALDEINYADGVVAGIRGVHLFQPGNVFDAFDSGCIGDRRDHIVGPDVNHIGLVGGHMCREQVMIVGVHRQVVETLPLGSRQVKFRNFPEREHSPRASECQCRRYRRHDQE